jgi:hypothetical protein
MIDWQPWSYEMRGRITKRLNWVLKEIYFSVFMTKGAIQQMNGGFHLPCGNARARSAQMMKEVAGSEVEERKLVA